MVVLIVLFEHNEEVIQGLDGLMKGGDAEEGVRVHIVDDAHEEVLEAGQQLHVTSEITDPALDFILRFLEVHLLDYVLLVLLSAICRRHLVLLLVFLDKVKQFLINLWVIDKIARRRHFIEYASCQPLQLAEI